MSEYRESPPSLFYCPKGCTPAWRTSYEEPCGHAAEHEIDYRLLRVSASDEPYRYCVYCGVDCEVEASEHEDECPSVTGRYPVEMMGPHPTPARCGRCERRFEFADHYCHVRTDDINGLPAYECVCDDCALGAFVEEAP